MPGLVTGPPGSAVLRCLVVRVRCAVLEWMVSGTTSLDPKERTLAKSHLGVTVLFMVGSWWCAL